MTEKYQSATLTLSDGRRVTCFGPAQVTADDDGLRAVAVEFSSPTPMPAGTHWQTIDERPRLRLVRNETQEADR